MVIEEILQDAVELGDVELAAQARLYLGSQGRHLGEGAEGPEMHVGKVAWGSPDEPGRGRVHIAGRIWGTLDYRDRLPVTVELASRMRECQVGEAEERQCVFLNTAAAYLQYQEGVDPRPQDRTGAF